MSDQRINLGELQRQAEHLSNRYAGHTIAHFPLGDFGADVLALVEAVEAAHLVLRLANKEARLIKGGRMLQDALARFDFGEST
jgi:hypothetical protein